MSFFAYEIVTAARSSSGDGCRRRPWRSAPPLWKRSKAWRFVAGDCRPSDKRRIVIAGPLPPRIEIEPVTGIVSLTKWLLVPATPPK